MLVSSAGVSTKSLFPYTKKKAELDEAVTELGFRHTVLVKPGVLVGTREQSRPSEAFVQAIARDFSAISNGWSTEFVAQDVDVVDRAAVAAGMQ